MSEGDHRSNPYSLYKRPRIGQQAAAAPPEQAGWQPPPVQAAWPQHGGLPYNLHAYAPVSASCHPGHYWPAAQYHPGAHAYAPQPRQPAPSGYQQAPAHHQAPTGPAAAPWRRQELQQQQQQVQGASTLSLAVAQQSAPVRHAAEQDSGRAAVEHALLMPAADRQRIAAMPAMPAAGSKSAAGATERGAPHAPRCASACPAAADAHQPVVVVWDLDETLILFNSLLNGQWAAAAGGAGQASKAAATALGERWQDAILDLCDRTFKFDQVEDVDYTTFSDLEAGLPSTLGVAAGTNGAPEAVHAAAAAAPVGSSVGASVADSATAVGRHVAQQLQQLYPLHGGGIDPDSAEQWRQLREETDDLTGGWLAAAARLLLRCSGSNGGRGIVGTAAASADRRVVHTLVTTSQLVPAYAKLLLFGLSSHFALEDVYSARAHGKLSCFEKIQAKYGSLAAYCVIGDSLEERRAAEQMRWPFIKVCLTGTTKQLAGSSAVGTATKEDASAGGFSIFDMTAELIVDAARRKNEQCHQQLPAGHGGN